MFCHVGELNQTSLGQNSNDATYDVQGQQKSQITKFTLCKKKLFKTLTSKRYIGSSKIYSLTIELHHIKILTKSN